MTSNNRAAIRQFILRHFSDDELDELCFDQFPDLSTELTIGLTKSQKAIALINYCERDGQTETLASLLAQLRPEADTEQLGALGITMGLAQSVIPTEVEGPYAGQPERESAAPPSATPNPAALPIVRELPEGTVTFLFTDIERSTPLWEQYPEAMKAALALHDRILSQSVEEARGVMIKSTGDGAYAAFAAAADALNAAVMIQHRLTAESWLMLGDERVRVRIGIHTGEAELRDRDYHGPTLNRTARLMSAGHGGQVLVSSATAALLQSRLPAGVTLRDLGEHRLKGLSLPEHIYQIVAPGLATDFPPLAVLDVTLGNLPPSLTSFIGRKRELSDVRDMLRNTRLLTLIGVGGTGKSRLSLEVAAERQHAFRHGTWLVELAPVRNPELVPQAVADILNLAPSLGVSLEQTLATFLQDRQLMLVLDNCEHLGEACAQLAGYLLRRCPGLTILATSREGLGVPGESVYPVPALPLPPASGLTAEAAEDYEALRLFAERARALKPTFQITNGNARAVAEIARRLDGIPLAIELAAARVSLFSPEQIAARLNDRFRLLDGGSRSSLPHQQTLRAAVDWSYDLLSEEERQMLQRLSVFPGGWSYEAAEAVSGRLDTLHLLISLINKSLVQVDETGVESRYYFLETIREYALERLAENDNPDRFLARMLTHLSDMAAANEPGFHGANQLESLRRFDAENDNFRVALEWGATHDPAAAARLAAALWLYWFMHGRFREGYETYARLEAAMTAADVVLPDLDRARFLQGLCSIVWPLGDYDTVERMAHEGLPLFQAAGEESGTAQLYHLLAFATEGRGGLDEGNELRDRGVAIARRIGDAFTLSILLQTKGVRRAQAGDLDEAYALLGEAFALAVMNGGRWNQQGIEAWLCRVELARGNFDDARAHVAAVQVAARQFDDRRAIAASFELLGMIAYQEGNLAEARRQAETAVRQMGELGLGYLKSRTLLLLGDIALADENVDEARTHYKSAVAEAISSNDVTMIDQAQARLDGLG